MGFLRGVLSVLFIYITYKCIQQFSKKIKKNALIKKVMPNINDTKILLGLLVLFNFF